MKEEKKNREDEIILLLKTMKKEYLHDTMTKGRFCFNHPTVFSKWENKDAAQYDRWEAHDAYEANNLVFYPIIGEKDGIPIYGQGRKTIDKAVIHKQSVTAMNTPICCFRCITQNECVIGEDSIIYSLGDTADRIMQEFGHDTFIIIRITPLFERLEKAIGSFIAMDVAYHDTLNSHLFNVDEQYKGIAEQLFRKDKKYEWQREYRIALPPTESSPIIVEIGSIEDIAICGDITDLRN